MLIDPLAVERIVIPLRDELTGLCLNGLGIAQRGSHPVK